MDKKFLFPSSLIFDNSNLVDDIHQTYLDLEARISKEENDDKENINDISKFLQEAQEFLENELPINVAKELFSTISLCFANFFDLSMPYFDLFFKKSKENSNYTIVTASILYEISNNQTQLSDEYNKFINDALDEILPQIQNKDQPWTIFHHKILPQFEDDLLINLLLNTKITQKTFYDFFRFILPRNINSTNQKYDMLIQVLANSDFIKIVPLTKAANDEIFEFLTTKNFDTFYKMSLESFMLVTTAAIFVRNQDDAAFNGLTNDTVLQFISIISMIYQKVDKQIESDNELGLFELKSEKLGQFLYDKIESIQKDNYEPVIQASLKILIENLSNNSKCLTNIPIDNKKEIKALLIAKYIQNRELFQFELASIYKFFCDVKNIENTKIVKLRKNDIYDFIISNMKEIDKFSFSDADKICLNLDIEKVIQYLNGLRSSYAVVGAISLFLKYLKQGQKNPIPKSFNIYLMSIFFDKVKAENWKDLLAICHFLKKYFFGFISFDEETLPIHINCLIQSKIPEGLDLGIDEFLEMISLYDCPKDKGEYFDHLFTVMMKDKEIRESYLTYNASSNSNEQYTVDDMLVIAMRKHNPYKDELIEVIKKHFYFNDKIFLKKLDYTLTTLPVSEFGLSVIDKLYKSIEMKPSNFQSFVCLKNIACYFPFLFNNDNILKVFDIVLPIFNYISLPFENKNIENQTELVKSAMCAISFLYSSLSAQFALDKFTTWLFTNILNFTDQQVSCLMAVLGSLYNDGLFHCVIPAYVVRYNFANTIGRLLERDIPNEKFRDFYRCSIYSFITRLYEELNKLGHYEIVQIIEFEKMENSFNYMYDYIYLTFPCLISINDWGYIKKLFSFSQLFESTDEVKNNWQNDINYLNRSRNNEPEIVKSTLQKLCDDSIKTEKVSKKSILFKFPVFTTKMVRYLVMNRGFVYCWYLYGFKFSLNCTLANELNKAGEILTRLENEAKENPDDKDNDDVLNFDIDGYLLPCYSQKVLFDNLVRQIVQSNSDLTFHSICKAIKSVCLKKSGLHLFIETLSKFIDEFDGNNSNEALKGIAKIVDCLQFLTSLDDFESVFVDSKICDKLLDLVLSVNMRYNWSLLVKTANFFICFKQKLPIRVTHLIGFLLSNPNNNNLSIIMKLCTRFEVDQLAHIDQLLMNTFDEEAKKGKITSHLLLLLDSYKGIGVKRKPLIIEFIEDLFSKMNAEGDDDSDNNNFYILGTLFDSISPKRGEIPRTEKVVANVDSIPNYITETSPEFWNLFSKYFENIMNAIRDDPNILTCYQFLLDFPELVDFNARASYFRKQMKNRINKSAAIRITIDRKSILETSFYDLSSAKAEDLLSQIQIDFEGEPVQDHGGGRREWFELLIKEIFRNSNHLFICSQKTHCYQPDPLSTTVLNYLELFRFAGVILARAMIEGQCVDCHLTKSFYKQILHLEPDLKDLEDYDPEIYQSLTWMLNNDVTPLYKVFAIENENHQVIQLKENGDDIDVDNENKNEYVRLHSNFIMKNQIKEQLNAFIEGFNSLIDNDSIRFFNANELDLLICGMTKIDVDDFERNTVFDHPYTKDTPVVRLFFKVISKWSNEDLCKLLMFMTGSSRIPVNGLTEFCEMTRSKFRIDSGGDPSLLPQAHTCFNLLHLPQYRTEEEMDKKLHQAIQYCDTFGLN